MCVCVHLRICTQTSHVSLYILPYEYAESTQSLHVCVYVWVHTHKCTCAQVYMCVYVVAYMDTEFTCVCVNIYVYARRVHVRVYTFQYIHTESKCVCVYSYVYTHGVYMCVGAHLCTCKLSFHVYMYIYLRIGTHRLPGCVCVIFVNVDTEFICVCTYSRT